MSRPQPVRDNEVTTALNCRARRTLKRALKRAVDELSAAGIPVRDALKPLPHSGGEVSVRPFLVPCLAASKPRAHVPITIVSIQSKMFCCFACSIKWYG